jgi:hypothetical protein
MPPSQLFTAATSLAGTSLADALFAATNLAAAAAACTATLTDLAADVLAAAVRAAAILAAAGPAAAVLPAIRAVPPSVFAALNSGYSCLAGSCSAGSHEGVGAPASHAASGARGRLPIAWAGCPLHGQPRPPCWRVGPLLGHLFRSDRPGPASDGLLVFVPSDSRCGRSLRALSAVRGPTPRLASGLGHPAQLVRHRSAEPYVAAAGGVRCFGARTVACIHGRRGEPGGHSTVAAWAHGHAKSLAGRVSR